MLWGRFTAKADENAARSNQLTCYNLKEAARLVGASTSKLVTWLNRRDNPIPHIKDGRGILIPGFQLGEWLKEESARNIGRTRTSRGNQRFYRSGLGGRNRPHTAQTAPQICFRTIRDFAGLLPGLGRG